MKRYTKHVQNKNYLYIAGGIIIVLILVGAFLIHTHMVAAPSSTGTSTPEIGTTTSNGNGISAVTSSGVTIQSTDNSGIQPPSLSGTIFISSSTSPEEQSTLQTEEQTLISQLRAAPTRVDLWLSLGVERKTAGDYSGAIAAWNYVAQAGPSTINYIAYGDLGDLYSNFDIDYAKAVTNYKAAIAINPKDIDYYRELYMIYLNDEHSKADAAAILTQGLSANPNNADLLELQKELQESGE